MGKTKQAYESGYQNIDKYVCNKCINDKDIIQYVKETGDSSKCSYCEKWRTKTVIFNDFIEFFLKHINNEYGDPLNDFVDMDDGKTFCIVELLDDIDVTENENLLNDIYDSLSDYRWCENPYWMPELSEILKSGWESFVDVVKHKSRYAFYRTNAANIYDTIPPSSFLEELSKVILKTELYTTLKKGLFIYRVRIHEKSEKLTKATELATPKIEYAKYSNRMSPAGIPMFYGAFDIGTAIKETFDPLTDICKIATVAKFKLLKDITMVDFSKVVTTPGLFEERGYSYHEVDFIRGFINDISKPIKKDGYEHIEYVPTQIVTEHFRYVHQDENCGEISGIIYPSSRNKGKNSIVIFCDNEHFAEKQEADNNSFFELERPTRRVNPKKFCQ